jgi:hypothetical protein
MTMVISMAVKEMSAVSKPLPHGVMQFLHSDYLEYLGIKINVRNNNYNNNNNNNNNHISDITYFNIKL